MDELTDNFQTLYDGLHDIGDVQVLNAFIAVKARIAELESQLKERDTRINDIHEVVSELIGGANDVAGYDVCVGRVDYEMLVDMFPLPSPPKEQDK